MLGLSFGEWRRNFALNWRLKIDYFNLKVESSIWGDHTAHGCANTCLTIGVFRRTDQNCFLAFAQLCDAFIPTSDHCPGSKNKLHWIPLVAVVESASVKLADVVNFDFRSNWDRGTMTFVQFLNFKLRLNWFLDQLAFVPFLFFRSVFRKLEHPSGRVLFPLLVILDQISNVLHSFLDCGLFAIILTHLKGLFKVLLRPRYLTNFGVGHSPPEECFDIFVLIFQNLGSILDSKMVATYLVIAVSQVETTRDFDFSYVFYGIFSRTWVHEFFLV